MMFWMGSPTAQTITRFSYEVACTETEVLFKGLTQDHKEVPFATGNVQGKVIVVFWKSPTGGFTVTVSTETPARSCVLVDGDSLKIIDHKEKISAQPTGLH